jgi:hypothetical protein
MAISACIGIIANSLILPIFGWYYVFAFFGTLSIISSIILLTFNDEPDE